MSFTLSILTPEGTAFEEPVTSIMVPGTEGHFGVMERHAPMLCALQPGILTVKNDLSELFFVLSGGVAEVQGDRTTILTETAIHSTDPSDAEQRLRQLLETCPKPRIDFRDGAGSCGCLRIPVLGWANCWGMVDG